MDSSEVEVMKCMSVRPELEWALHTPHGTARCGEGPDDFLVRLADVVRWFQRKQGLPFTVAVQRVIEGITADSLLHMFYLDGRSNGWARPMWVPTKFDRYLDGVPEEGGSSFFEWRAQSCIHSLRASWLMPSWELERLVNTGRPDGEPREYDSDKETPFEFCERRGGHVADFAIRISKANELWGWGHAAAAVALPDAVAGVQAAPAIETQGVIDWHSLVLHHKSLFISPAAWPESWRRIALVFHEAGHGARRGATTKKQMAEALGVARDTVDTLLNTARAERVEEVDRGWMLPVMVNGK